METTIMQVILYVGIMENKMETTIMEVYGDNGKESGNYYDGGYIGIMEKKMETTIMEVI